jgi:flagellum-specific ATP synthase
VRDYELDLDKYKRAVVGSSFVMDLGKVTRVTGSLIEGHLPGAMIGSLCRIEPNTGGESFEVEVVGFNEQKVLMLPLEPIRGVGLGARIVLERRMATIRVGDGLLGRVINGFGQPLDEGPELELSDNVDLYGEVKNPLSRVPIDQTLDVGVRSINGLLTVGKGQRVSIMSGSGVGKSVLLGMIAQGTSADVNVIALVGERGREVREFIEKDLGEQGLKKSIVVTVTSDESPLLRVKGAFIAASIAEYFSNKGKDVLLMMDSVTRIAMAQREIGLSRGEPPTTKGYTPSVFSLLPRLLERAGNFEGKGSITGIFSVLVEGDDMDDPIGDSVRSIVDGHIVLERSLAQRGHFPAVDVLQSNSRVMRNVINPDHEQSARFIRENMAIYNDNEDLINIGAYKPGANEKVDRAIRLHEPIERFLRQEIGEQSSFAEARGGLIDIMQRIGGGEE